MLYSSEDNCSINSYCSNADDDTNTKHTTKKNIDSQWLLTVNRQGRSDGRALSPKSEGFDDCHQTHKKFTGRSDGLLSNNESCALQSTQKACTPPNQAKSGNSDLNHEQLGNGMLQATRVCTGTAPHESSAKCAMHFLGHHQHDAGCQARRKSQR